MAVQSQSQGQIQEFASILKKRAGQVFLPAILIGSLGVAVGVLLPKKYTVHTQLELHETTLPVGARGADATAIQRDVGSAVWHIRSMERVRRVIEKLEWQDYTSIGPQKQYEYLQRVVVALRVAVVPARNMQGSSFISIDYTDSDGSRAEKFLNSLRDSYTGEVVERYRSNARAARDTMQNDLQEAERTYREKELQLAELKKRHGVSSTQIAPGRGQRDEDPVFERLNREIGKASELQTELVQNKSKLESLQKTYEAEPREVPETSIAGGVNYDVELKKIDADILDSRSRQEGLRPPHSQFQVEEVRIRTLEKMKQALLERETQPQSEVRLVPNPKRDTIKTQIEATELAIQQSEDALTQVNAAVEDLRQQHEKLAEVYREITVVADEVENWRAVYDQKHLNYENQRTVVEVIMRPEVNPFEVTEVAQAPAAPTSPNVPLIVTFAVLAGLGLGLTSAVVAEFGRGAFRSVGDVARSMAVPVLGAVNSIVTRAEARRTLTRRMMVASSTLILSGVVLWMTWAYVNRPRLLGARLTGMIDDVRSKLR